MLFYVQFVILFNNIKNVFTLRLEMQKRECVEERERKRENSGTIERRDEVEKEKEKKMNE